jgi:hypothetical protein
MKGTKHRDPLKTKTGKTRLGPLSIAQLEDLIEKTSSKKTKGKFRQKLDQLKKSKNVKSVADAA